MLQSNNWITYLPLWAFLVIINDGRRNTECTGVPRSLGNTGFPTHCLDVVMTQLYEIITYQWKPTALFHRPVSTGMPQFSGSIVTPAEAAALSKGRSPRLLAQVKPMSVTSLTWMTTVNALLVPPHPDSNPALLHVSGHQTWFCSTEDCPGTLRSLVLHVHSMCCVALLQAKQLSTSQQSMRQNTA